MFLPARRLTELKTWSGPTRSSSSTGGTMTTMIRLLAELRARADFLLFVEAMRLVTMPPRCKLRKRNQHDGRGRRICVANRVSSFDTIPSRLEKKYCEAILDQDPERDTISWLYLSEVRRVSNCASRSACRSIRAHRDHACSGWPWG